MSAVFETAREPRENLSDTLQALEVEGGAPALRKAASDLLRERLESGRAEIEGRFKRSNNGLAAARALAELMDEAVVALFDLADKRVFAAANPTTGERVALAAIGGYGRGTLAPFSDIDLLFLVPYKRTPRAEQIIEFMLYALWDMQLKVGQAVRSPEDCVRTAKSDPLIRTSMSERRFLAGDPRLYADFHKRFVKGVEAVDQRGFVEAKLAERDQRHRKAGDSRYMLEPNVKDGKGGQRDLQTLVWIAHALYGVTDIQALVPAGMLRQEEASRFAKADAFLWAVRCHLHWYTKRAEERLTFDVQAEMARRLGYTDHVGAAAVERFMKHYFLVAKDVGNLTRIFCSAFEADTLGQPRFWLSRAQKGRVDGFALEGRRLNIVAPDQFAKSPVEMIRLFAVAQRSGLDIHPNALRAVTRNLRHIGPELRADTEANRIFLEEILTGPGNREVSLRRMNDAGVLGRFILDFGRIVAQMQFDMYHFYTVDEHTLNAIGILNRIETGEASETLPLASTLIGQIASKRALALGVFLHDIGKGRGGNHSEIGAAIAERLGPRLGLTAEETETAAWLVKWHLAMSGTATKRDLDDPNTVEGFAALVQSPERLKTLTVLTTVDINAVGPGRWNNWKAGLIEDLYLRTADVLAGAIGSSAGADRVKAIQAEARALLPEWDDAQFARFMALGSQSYWLAFDAATHARHARLVNAAERDAQKLAVETRVDPARDAVEVTIHAADHPGLFARLAGAFAVSRLSIVDAKIFTLANGTALDTFWAEDPTGDEISASKRAKLVVMIERTLAGALKPPVELERLKSRLPDRSRPFKVTPRALIDNEASSTHTIIEINGRDRPGLLHDVTMALTRLNLQIATAKVSTYGHKAIDVFYVKDIFGLKVTDPAKHKRIRKSLLAALADPGERE
ncbi:MAG TPA: [protein-PII] uridylyltransferase [Alphaproteobacteria bacterium]|nr:[protein-PII] uridylyltransferase [Alphaproteobacteria bacterium]